MKSFLFIVSSFLFSIYCEAQGPYPFIAANNEAREQEMFYPNSCVLIQKQEFTESTLKEKLNGTWRCASDTNVGLFFGNNLLNGRAAGIMFYYKDTIRAFDELRLTDTIINWDEYEGTGFYLFERGDKEMTKGNFCLLKNLKEIHGACSSNWNLWQSEPGEYRNSDGVKIEYYGSIYKVLQLYDKELIVSSPWGDPVIYKKVN